MLSLLQLLSGATINGLRVVTLMSSGGQLRVRAYEKEGPSEIEAKEKTEKWNNEQKKYIQHINKKRYPFFLFEHFEKFYDFGVTFWNWERDILLTLKLEFIKRDKSEEINTKPEENEIHETCTC